LIGGNLKNNIMLSAQKNNFISVNVVDDQGNTVQNFINAEHVLLVRNEDNYIIIKLINGDILKVNDIPIFLLMDKFYH
jgi:hypothetical protein